VDLVEAKQIEEGQAKLKQFTISARVDYSGRPAAPPSSGKKGSAATEATAQPEQPAPPAPGGDRAPGPQAQAGMPGAPALPGRVAPVDPSAAVPPPAAAPVAVVTVPIDAARTAAGVSEGHDAATARAAVGGPPS
ncbi:MAG: hypothetical protein ACKO2K_19505, partial [Alphaproteobacteria bacterium]